ncbi:sensor histidine kinase [bacterium]|nr:sensor histidine kinase [bacterium]MBU3929529.1 sensor histidine kinase [bacterium]
MEKRTLKKNIQEKDLYKWALALKERTKELECLFGISRIVEKQFTLEETMRKITNLIPSSWQYSKSTCARIVLEGKVFKTANFKKTKYMQCSDIIVDRNVIGTLEVYYLEKKPQSEEGPFLKAERNLINALSERLGGIIERKKVGDELKKSHKKLRELFEHLETVREDERKNIAHDIHDELGQSLTALKVDIGWLNKNLHKDKDLLLEQTSSMLKFIDTTVQNMQRIVLNLRPVLLDDFGISAAVLWYTEDFEKRSGIKCKISLKPNEIIIDKNRSILIFRIYQELLTNVIRHAKATSVKIQMIKKTNRLILDIEDNGRGITEQKIFSHRSFGLLGVKERIHFWGGKLQITGTPDKGTKINIELPLK